MSLAHIAKNDETTCWVMPAMFAINNKVIGVILEYFRSDFETFEEAMQEVLATVIASPDFLYLTQTMNDDRKGTERISDMEFATRLSFFLWASIPDVELLGAAYQGDLRKPEILKSQIARMLDDPRADRFAQHFVEQWLGLEGLDSTTHVRDAIYINQCNTI